MRLLIDADGCPVVRIAVKAAKFYNVECMIFCDTSHYFSIKDATVITVSQGPDSVDFALLNRVSQGDIVVTQDYGLAAMCLAKKAVCVNQNGMMYTEDNIDMLLMQRYTAKRIRMAGGRVKGVPKRTQKLEKNFFKTLQELFETAISDLVDMC